MKDITKIKQTVFEKVKRVNEYGQEYWSARDLARILDYSEYRFFLPVVEKAKEACKNSGFKVADHFEDMHEMVPIGSGAERAVPSIALSRYACYLIVQNADPSKEIVALGQTYFAYQTRKQEIQEQKRYEELATEDEKRLFLRREMREHNKQLVEAAKNAGVVDPLDYAIFQNHGYMGLYGGMTAKDIQKRKKLRKKDNILDHMGSTELAANLFRATQAEEKLKRDNIKGKENANKTHFEVGRKVRKTIEELGGTMPEELPTPEKSIKEIEKKEKKPKQLSAKKKGARKSA
ncbi:MAG TPA: DNA damage-inducible protein D [bacterium]|nr:DNA damage-inducible protein D [bacterium]